MTGVQTCALPISAKALLTYDLTTDQLMLNKGTPAVPSWVDISSSSAWTLASGILYPTDSTSKLASGGELLPDVDAGGFCFNQGAGAGNIQTFKSSWVAHPFTNLAETDTYAEFRKVSGSAGGLRIEAFSDASYPFVFKSYATIATGGSAFIFDANETNGGTGAVGIAATDILAEFSTANAAQCVIYGDGDRSEEHTSELQSHSFISYAVFCLKKKN